MSWTFPAAPREIATARRAAGDFAQAAGVPDPPLAAMRLAISEAMTNAVLHAFRDRDEEHVGTVTVAVDLTDPGCPQVVVSDDGMGLCPRDDSPGAGLGLALIERMADSTEYRTAPGGTGFEMWMGFRR